MSSALDWHTLFFYFSGYPVVLFYPASTYCNPDPRVYMRSWVYWTTWTDELRYFETVDF